MATDDLDMDFLTAAGFDAAEIELVRESFRLRRQRIANGDTRLAELVAANEAATAELIPRMAVYWSSLGPCSVTWQSLFDNVECSAYRRCGEALASYEAGLDQ